MKSNNKHDRQLKYKLDKTNLTATVGKADRLIINCIIPEEITVDNQKYRIINIANYAFNGCQWLKKISLPNSLKELETMHLENVYLLNQYLYQNRYLMQEIMPLKNVIL